MASGLRVGLVVPRFAPFRGGVETYTRQAAQALAERGANVTVVTQAPRQAELPSRAVEDGYAIERHPLPVGSSFAVPSPAAVRASARSGRFDVLWVHSYHTPLAWMVAECRAAATVLVLTPHYHGTGHTPLRSALHPPYRLAGRRLLAASRRIVVDTQAEAGLVRRDFPRQVWPDKLVVIPLAVNDPVRGRPFCGNSPVVLTVARQEPYKRTDQLIEAIAELRRRGVLVRLVVVGAGSGLVGFRRLAERLRVQDVVTLTGPVDDEALGRWWATATMYATASEQEAFGIAAAQALVAGLPVVLSEIPAHREVVHRAGPAALAQLVAVDTTRRIAALRYADAIEHFLTDVGPREERAIVCGLPTEATMAESLMNVLATASACSLHG